MTINKYQLWITANGETEKCLLPVVPDMIKVSDGSKNESISVVDLGEVTIIQGRPALTFSFSSFCPIVPFQGTVIKVSTDPQYVIERLTKWKNSKKPVHFIVTGANIDVYCTIEKLDWEEKGGDVGTIYYSMVLKEYREISIRQVNTDIKNNIATIKDDTTRIDNTIIPKTYTVQKGDCLFNISKKIYGDGSKWKDIHKANPNIKNPNLIYPGDIIKLV